ncbi:MAG TPA: SGNH/GDSL hydrolase family protein, partial [Longimicrobium sp.]
MKSGMSRLRLLATTGAALALSACVGDDQTLVSVPTPINGVNATTGVSYFDRYVSLGNSITAGFQSSGLVDSLQERSYAVLLAQRGGTTDFRTPGVSRPGCPVPFVTPLGAGVTLPEQNCTLTLTGSQPSLSRNLAVPGARLRDLLSVPSPLTNAGRLNLLLVGPRSQVRAMKESQPTFVSVWIGNNDALEATVGGVLGPLSAGADSSLTPLATFQAQLAMLVDSIKSAAPRGVLLVGVVDAIQAVPLIQPGAFFFLARGADGRFQGKPVNDNCSPVNALGQPNPLAQ